MRPGRGERRALLSGVLLQSSRFATFLVIHFHQGEERLALRLAQIAERVYDTAARTGMALPGRRTHVVLVDQNDYANGSATVVPWNAIQIDATPPTGVETIGNTDDWLE